MNKNLEITRKGNANGQSLISSENKDTMIKEASGHFGKFLTSLGVDWENDPNSSDTPMRVAKAYVNDLWKGRYEKPPTITAFPSDGYNGIILEQNIPLISMCSHHHQTIMGKCHIGYIPSVVDSKVLGLSKLNRIVEHFSRRGAIQEQLTMAIHNAVNKSVHNNQGVIVILNCAHQCVSCRGVKHMGASMVTSEVSGAFSDHNKTAKNEIMHMLNLSPY